MDSQTKNIGLVKFGYLLFKEKFVTENQTKGKSQIRSELNLKL